jgi:hypothetical protein
MVATRFQKLNVVNVYQHIRKTMQTNIIIHMIWYKDLKNSTMAILNLKNMSKIVNIAINRYFKLKLYIRYCFNVTKYKRIGFRGKKSSRTWSLQTKNLNSNFKVYIWLLISLHCNDHGCIIYCIILHKYNIFLVFGLWSIISFNWF